MSKKKNSRFLRQQTKMVLNRKLAKRLRKRPRIYKAIEKGVAKRHTAERRFQLYAKLAIGVSFVFLAFLMISIVSKGYSAFFTTKITLPVTFYADEIDPAGTRDAKTLSNANYTTVLRRNLQSYFPDATSRRDAMSLIKLMSKHASYRLQQEVMGNPSVIGSTQDIELLASSDVDMLRKGFIRADVPSHMRRVSDKQLAWLEKLTKDRRLNAAFNIAFLTNGDSREPELAGILASLMGSVFVIISCMMVALPLGVMTGVYLEEFARKNRFTELIEVNINNLAAVPSIVFGLLGLSLYLQWMHLPRSASIVGGLTLAMLVLPVIVITTRTALKAVPPSIRDAALALGASKMQTVTHHTLPLAIPGIMTGTILGIARALGETAPLLMIGMVAFVVDVPTTPMDPATALPVQVYLWSDSPELGFAEKTSAAIMVLLVLLVMLNATAVWIRKKYERKW